ncbi:MAG: hypothetical protein ACP5JJ_13710 [Anaerolineae bacterium]
MGAFEQQADVLRGSRAPAAATVVDNSGGLYPTEDWRANYFSVSPAGALSAHQVTVRVPAGLEAVCPPVRVGWPGCVYAVRRWGFILRPSALADAGADLGVSGERQEDADALRTILRAAAFDLPGEFVIASPEHPFQLVSADGVLRGSSILWRTYLGALSFYVSGGRTDADFVRFSMEAEESYRQAVEFCLAALEGKAKDRLP